MTAKPALHLIRPLVPAARASIQASGGPTYLPTFTPPSTNYSPFLTTNLTFAILVCSSHEPFDISLPLPPSPHHHHPPLPHHLQLLLLLLLTS